MTDEQQNKPAPSDPSTPQESAAAPQASPAQTDAPAPESAAAPQASPAPDAPDQDLEKEIADALGDFSVMDMVEDPTPETASGAPLQAGDHAMAKGSIVAIHDDDVFVDLGGKSQGIVPLTQFEQKPELGAEMEFVVEGVLGDEGLIKLSRQGAVEKATWQTLERGMTIEAMVTGSNTGGLELKVAGQRAFMPASQIDLNRIEQFNEFLGKKVKCKVIELDRRGKKIVVSRRAVMEEEQAAEREKVLAEIQVGDVREGTVRSLQQYGAFVDLGGIDGLVHVSDLSWERVGKPEEVVKVGQKVRVKVLKIEGDGQRISLGMKQVGPNPWDTVEQKYVPGTQASGRVAKLANFGVFVELEPGVEGLIPMGELSWDRVGKASSIVEVNQMVTVKVLDVDIARQRISLSLKQLSDDPWTSAEGEFAVDTIIEGKVTKTTDFGAFVELAPGIEGMIHISELSDRRVGVVEEVVKAGQDVKVKVISFDPGKRRIGLSIKALTEKPGEARGGRGGKASRDDLRKYSVKDTKKATTGESLGALMDKFGGGDGGLKGGIG
jgi:small subunit ribosomal protein S1